MRYSTLLLAAIFGLPVVEIYLFVVVGEQVGAFNTVLLVLISAVVGIQLLRAQGWMVLRAVNQSMARGETPALALVQTGIRVAAGILLIVPGFFSDILALLMLIPPLQRGLARQFLSRARPVRGRKVDVVYEEETRRPQSELPRRPRTLEGESRREE